MTITKEQLDAFVERETAEYDFSHLSEPRCFKDGALLVAPLLLQACESLAHRWPGETGFHVSEFYRQTLSQIEAAVKPKEKV